jgi:alpha-beta hydrolase superfamily lysophospholipase
LLTVGIAVTFACFALVAVQKYRAERQLFFPIQQPAHLPASSSGIEGASDISIDAAGTKIRGWYAPTKNHALVILCHGAGANRSQLATEGRALVAAGFGVLLFDWPGQGESGGAIRWNEGERVALRAAISWLLARPEADSLRLGAYGFSMGGYTLSQVAAEDTRIEAVVLAGTPSDQRQQVRFQYRRLGPLAQWPALFALGRGGMQVDVRKPIDEVKKIDQRPILTIAGSADDLVAPSMAGDLARAASQPDAVYLVEGASHGNYYAVAGTPYLERVVSFFRRALLIRPR